MVLLAITGPAGSGKDWVGEQIRKNNPRRTVIRFAFADLVKEEIEGVLADHMHLPGLWRKPYSPEVRQLLLFWGTELRRRHDPDYWINKAAEKIQYYTDDEVLMVVTDARFPNEYELLQSYGARFIRLYAPPSVLAERLNTPVIDHVSERFDQMPPGTAYLTSTNNAVFPSSNVDSILWEEIQRELRFEFNA